MKKAILLLSVFCFSKTMAQQKSAYKPGFRLNAYTNYVFDDKFDSYYSAASYYNGKIKGGFQWGLGLEYMVNPYQGIELSYLRLDTKAPTTYYDGTLFGGQVKSRDFDMALNYLFIGSTRYFRPNPKVEPYFGVQLGMAIIGVSNPINDNSATGTKFAWGIKGGTNLWFSRSVALKLQMGLQSVTQAVGGGLYFSGAGVSTGLESYSTIYQFSLGGGLAFRFGN